MSVGDCIVIGSCDDGVHASSSGRFRSPIDFLFSATKCVEPAALRPGQYWAPAWWQFGGGRYIAASDGEHIAYVKQDFATGYWTKPGHATQAEFARWAGICSASVVEGAPWQPSAPTQKELI